MTQPATKRLVTEATGPLLFEALVPTNGLRLRVIADAAKTDAQNTAALNTALAAGGAAGAVRHVTAVGDFVLTQSLIIWSKTTFDVTNASFTLSDAVNSQPMLMNKAATPSATLTGVGIASGASAITGTGFTAAAINGKRVGIVGAGVTTTTPSSVTNDLFGIITVTSDTAATIAPVTSATAASAVTAKSTVSGASMKVYDLDTDIRIVGGGTWTRGTPVAVTPEGNHRHLWSLRHIVRLGIHSRPRMISTSSKYAIALGDVHGVELDGASFDTASDGVHIAGPSSGIRVGHLTGITRDDMFSITATDYGYFGDVSGDVVGVTVAQIEQNGVGGGVTLLKVIGGTGTAVRGVEVNNLSGTCAGRAVAISDDGTGPSDVDIKVRNITVRTLSDTAALIECSASLARTLDFDGIDLQVGNARATSDSMIKLIGNTERVRLRGVRASSAGTSAFTTVFVGPSAGKVGILELEDWNYASGNDNHVAVQAHTAASEMRIIGRNLDITKCSRLVYMDGNFTGSAVLRIFTSDCRFTNFGRIFDVAGTVEWTYSNVYADTFSDYFRSRATVANTVTIRGRGLSGIRAGSGSPVGSGLNTSGQTGTLTLKCKAPDFPLGLAQTGVGKTMGDEAYNVDGALACGAGPVLSDGTNWKHKYTGATY